MGAQDRDYYRGDDGDLSGGLPIVLGYSWPFGVWFGVPVRLHFWLLFSMALSYLRGFTSKGFVAITILNVLLIIALLCHEFGHRIVARWVGGSHNEFMLWPIGGMYPPKAPPYPWPTFVTHVGGILANLLLCGACVALLAVIQRLPSTSALNPIPFLFGGMAQGVGNSFAYFLIAGFFSVNAGLIAFNLLPFYWFDGGYLLQSILWPWTGLFRAINVTCIIGMIIAAPMALFALMAFSLFGLIFWGGLFADAFMRRRQLRAAGTGELDAVIAYSANHPDDDRPARGSRPARWPSRNAAKRAAREAAAERKEQDEIDTILAKVHASGMQSLTWMEKRALKRATERQRRRSGAP